MNEQDPVPAALGETVGAEQRTYVQMVKVDADGQVIDGTRTQACNESSVEQMRAQGWITESELAARQAVATSAAAPVPAPKAAKR